MPLAGVQGRSPWSEYFLLVMVVEGSMRTPFLAQPNKAPRCRRWSWTREAVTDAPGDGGRRTGPALEAMYQLVRWLIPALDRFPRRQKFLLGDRIQTTALTALERLVEATFTRDRNRLLDRTNVDLDKLRLLLRLSKDLGCLDARRYEHAARRIDEVGRLVGGWRRAHRDPAD